MVLVDANVILDWVTEDPIWSGWSLGEMDRLSRDEGLAVNPLILAEVGANFATPESVERTLPPSRFARLPLPFEAAFLAGQAYRRYKQQEKGQKRSPLPDFYIGAHAEVEGLALLTRDVRRYRTYFPNVRLITPPSAS